MLVKVIPDDTTYKGKGRPVLKFRGTSLILVYPESRVHGANMGPIWGRQDPGGPHVGPMNFGIWVKTPYIVIYLDTGLVNRLFGTDLLPEKC